MDQLSHKDHFFSKTFFSVLIASAFFTFWSFNAVLAINTCSSGWQVNSGATKTVDCHTVCKKVKNNGSSTIFVPTKSSNEWSQFRIYHPSNISLSSCVVSKPNLKVDDIWLGSSGYDDGKVLYSITNHGNASCGQSYASRSIGGVDQGDRATNSLDPGQTHTTRISGWDCDDGHSGSYQVVVCADDWGDISESNEGDNCKTKTISCGSSPSPTLSVSLSANPSSGNVPLTAVEMKASVTGSATGNIHYQFDCNGDGNYKCDITRPETTRYCYCDYYSAGGYIAKVRVTREGQTAYATASVTVGSGCECSSGACCSNGCNYDSSSTVCSTWTDYDYRCSGTGCGADAQRKSRSAAKHCSGSSSSCNGSTSYGNWSSWSTIDNCTSAEKCSSDNSSYASCNANSSCINLNLPSCPFNDTAGVWVKNKNSGWSDTNYCSSGYTCTHNKTRCLLGENCTCEAKNGCFICTGDPCTQRVIQTGGNTFQSSGIYQYSKKTDFCKTNGASVESLPKCDNFTGNPGDVYITPVSSVNEGSWNNWASDKSKWCRVGASCSHDFGWGDVKVYTYDGYRGECYQPCGVGGVLGLHNCPIDCRVCVIK